MKISYKIFASLLVLGVIVGLMPNKTFAAVTVTYNGFENLSFGVVPTPMYSAIPVGTAYANRRVLIALVHSYADQPPSDTNTCGASSVQINGVSVGSNYYIVDSASNWTGYVVFAWADIPTGTTVTANVTCANAVPTGFGTQYGMGYSFDKTAAASAPSAPAKAQGTTVSSLANSINTTAGGFLIWSVNTYHLTSQTSFALASSDETITVDINHPAATTPFIMGHVSNTSALTPSHATGSWVGSAQNALGAMLFWPAAASTSVPAASTTIFGGGTAVMNNGGTFIWSQT